MLKRYRFYFRDKDFSWSFLLSVIFFIASLVFNHFAGLYATHQASNAVTDIVLSNIPTYDVDVVFIYGAMGLAILIAAICLYRPQRAPFILKSISLFIVVRSIFISLTHIGPFPTKIEITSRILGLFTFGGDFFFSGHTGLPFLMALILWDEPYLRYLFLVLSFVFGVVVLLGHLHYSIDVLAAFFITCTIYHLAEKFFKKDREIFRSNQ